MGWAAGEEGGGISLLGLGVVGVELITVLTRVEGLAPPTPLESINALTNLAAN